MKAVFLDRDGVIVADKGYHYKLSDFELLSDVPKAIKKLNDCRKPGFGMFLQAAKEHSIDLSDSWMVGDNISDMIAGNSAGCRCIFIGSTKPVEAESCARNLN